ncbi:MAG: hypothetical protein COA74_15280 [Gammaproteobacteria bacterium]|nr:MAG: hypothetical protein COA74_15280 [Gammaproteobacteria bacterium]
MNKLSIITSLLIAFTLVSCGSPETKKKNVILDPAVKALNKAKSVEQTLLDAEAERKKKMQEQETGDDDTN